MKKFVKILIAILLPLYIVFSFPTVKADAGWDGDYDYGGGGGFDTGGGWDYDYDHDYGGGGGGIYISTDDPAELIIIFIIIIVVAIIIGAKTVAKNANYKTNESPLPDTTTFNILDENEIREVIPDFNMTEFENIVFEIYKQIQTAWMDFDYDTLRKYTTDELYNVYHSQLLALSMKHQKNIMKDFEKISLSVIGMEHNESSVSLKVRTTIKCFDYVVDENNNAIRGNNLLKVTYVYEMIFVKGLSTKDNKCPNCNAPLENNNSSVCPYCNSTIISDNHDWILSKKQVISQTSNKKL